MGVYWVLTTEEQLAAFRRDWLLGIPLREMAALHGFRNINTVSRTARRLGLAKRPGGPRENHKSPEVLKNGRWEPRGGVQVWVEGP